MDPIPYGRHLIEDDDVAAVVDVLRNGLLTQGPIAGQLERALAARCGAREAVVASSGTSALHLAVLAAGVGPQDQIIVPAMTFLATANCGVQAGAAPRFADVDFESVLMTADLVAPRLTDTVRAVLPVHFAGNACDMKSISDLVRSECPRAVIIEDACHALGGHHADGTPIGSPKWADMVVFSMHPVKQIAAGEGGVVLTDDDTLARRMRLLRNHGMTKDRADLTAPDEGPWYYEMHEPGHNYRLPDVNCALALSQLEKLDRFTRRRREIAAEYLRELAPLPNVCLPQQSQVDRSAWHIFCLHVDFSALGKSRRRVVDELRRLGIGTQVHYYPVPLQPYYRKRLGHKPGDFPGAEKHYRQALTIPLYPAMTDDDVGRVIESLKRVLLQHS